MQQNKTLFWTREIIMCLLFARLIPVLIHQGVTAWVKKPNTIKKIEESREQRHQEIRDLEQKKETIQQTINIKATIVSLGMKLIEKAQENQKNELAQELSAIKKQHEEKLLELQKTTAEITAADNEIKTLNKEIESWLQHRDKILLNVLLIVGILAVIIGYIAGIHALGLGFLLGGLSSIFKGYWLYWTWLSDRFIFFSLLAAFILLIFAVWFYPKLHKKS